METNNTNNKQEKRKKKNPVSWFKGLKKSTRIVLCATLGVGVASAITFPVLAVTVWNNDSTEIKLTVRGKVYTSGGLVNLKANKKYHIKDVDVRNLEDCTDQIGFLISANEIKIETNEYIKDVTIKSNKMTFEQVETFEGLDNQQHKYFFERGDQGETSLVIGKRSFGGDEYLCSIFFTAKKSGSVGIGLMSGE